MCKNIKISLLAVSLILFCTTTYGQKKKNADNLTKRVEVTKRYSPNIGSAIKRDILPGTISKVQLETPKFDYSIAYKPQTYEPTIDALKSIEIEIPQLESIVNGYASAAFGYPLQSAASAYYTTNPMNALFVGMGINHYGFWGELGNHMGDLVNSNESQSNIFTTIDYKKYNLQVTGDLRYSYNIYDMNGFYLPISVPDYVFNSDKNTSNIIDFNLDIATPHIVGNQWDYGFGVDAYYLSDNHNFQESLMKFSGGVAKGFSDGKNRFGFDVEYVQYVSSTNTTTSYTDMFAGTMSSNLIFTPSYRRVGARSLIDFSFGFNIEMGEKYGDKSGKLAITPNLRYELRGKRLNYFVGVRSGYDYNSYNNLVKINPYLLSGQTANGSNWGDAYIGLEGTILSWLTWFVEGGIKYNDNMIYFYNILDGNTFSVDGSKKTYGFVNTSVSALLTESLSAHITYNFQSVDLYTYAMHNLDFDFRYQVAPRWQVIFGGEMVSSREFAGKYNTPHIILADSSAEASSYTITHVPTKLYLSAGVEYKISDIVSLTMDLDNILNSKMYKFNNYQGIGINGMVGVNVRF